MKSLNSARCNQDNHVTDGQVNCQKVTLSPWHLHSVEERRKKTVERRERKRAALQFSWPCWPAATRGLATCPLGLMKWAPREKFVTSYTRHMSHSNEKGLAHTPVRRSTSASRQLRRRRRTVYSWSLEKGYTRTSKFTHYHLQSFPADQSFVWKPVTVNPCEFVEMRSFHLHSIVYHRLSSRLIHSQSCTSLSLSAHSLDAFFVIFIRTFTSPSLSPTSTS